MSLDKFAEVGENLRCGINNRNLKLHVDTLINYISVTLFNSNF